MIVYFVENQFSCYPINFKTWIDELNYIYTEVQLNNFLKDIVKIKNIFSFVPVNTHIEYLIVHLQKLSIDEIIIYEIRKYIIEIILLLVVHNDKQYEVWKLIHHIYISKPYFPELIDFFDDVDQELVDYITKIKIFFKK